MTACGHDKGIRQALRALLVNHTLGFWGVVSLVTDKNREIESVHLPGSNKQRIYTMAVQGFRSSYNGQRVVHVTRLSISSIERELTPAPIIPTG